MTLSHDEAARLMSMKVDSIAEVHDVADGTLVITSEGAQTLIDATGRCSAVLPRRDVLNLAGRGSVTHHVDEPGPDLRPVDPADVIPPPAGETPVDADPAVEAAGKKTPAKKA